jgi:N-formylglutamate amidohydrolase
MSSFTNINDYIRLRQGSSRVLLEVPHSGTMGIGMYSAGVPDILKKRLQRWGGGRDTITFGCDVAVPEMSGYEDLAHELDLTCIEDNLARVFTDVNRARSETNGYVIAGLPRTGPIHGVVWSHTVPRGINLRADQTTMVMDAVAQMNELFAPPMTKSEFEELMGMVYDPYHFELRGQHRRIIEEHGSCVHLALHSLPPIQATTWAGAYITGAPATRGYFDPIRGDLPDVILIHNGFKAAGRDIVQRIRRAFEMEGLIVMDGEGPFLGDRGVTALCGDPQKGRHVIGIEHVTHGIETGRMHGILAFDVDKARAHRKAYKNAVLAAGKR